MLGVAAESMRKLSRAFSGRAATALTILAVSAPLLSCDFVGQSVHRLAGGACPRPQLPVSAQPQFNDQQREIRALRQRGFRGDFFAQLELARRYEGKTPNDRNLEDPVEAATWYGLALANPSGYEALAGRGMGGRGDRMRMIAQFDDCRTFERDTAYHDLNRILARMDGVEWDKVRNRMIYVLSTQGADGFRTLARMHDVGFGPFGEPVDDEAARDAQGGKDHPGLGAALQLFPRNDIDAYLYNDLAAQTGDVGAFVLMKDFEHAAAQRQGYAGVIESKVNRWVPPYEFYPPESPASGVPHSDESEPQTQLAEAALQRIGELPFIHVVEAMRFLGIACKSPFEISIDVQDVRALQAMLGREQTGHLTPLEKVRAIQYAATNGSAKAQLVLAVMYAEGVGVPMDYARSYAWFAKADKQGSPEAKYAMSSYFSLGVSGVADQDKAKAVVYQIDAALAGFKPSADRLSGILARTAGGPRLDGERSPW
jgi:TPR repeat protein